MQLSRSSNSLIGLSMALTVSWMATAGERQPGRSFGWRGDGLGCFSGVTPPIEWDGETGTNILWKTKVGLSKFSSPTCVGGKIFVVAEPARLICVDAENGAILWERKNGFEELPAKAVEKPVRGTQGNTTPTPVSDGRFIYAAFGSGIAAAYDLEGKRQWIRYLDAPPGLEYGRSCSPAVISGTLLVSVHHLFALDVKTGVVRWENEKVTERYGTPLAIRLGGVEVVLAPSGHVVRVSDGTVLSTGAEMQFASPVAHDPVAYFIGTLSSAVVVAKADEGVAVKSIWNTEVEGTFYASPVYDQGLLYTASNEGNFLVMDAADGKTVLNKEIDIGAAGGRPGLPNANIYPSLALAAHYLFLSNDAGETLVLEAGREYREVKRNNLGEGFSGSPVFEGSRMYVRTRETVYCIGPK